MNARIFSYLGITMILVLLTVSMLHVAWATDEAPATVPSKDTATLIGKVTFKDEAPFRRAINFGANLDCKHMHKDKVYYEDVIVNDDGTLKDVFVYIKSGVKGDFKPPTKPLVVDQQGCVFIPHVAGVMVGQTIEFVNSDPVLHNVRTAPKKQKVFNISQPTQGMRFPYQFEQAEIGVSLRCDVHHWMASYVHVLAHPFFAVTKEKGTFKIEGIPPRTYVLEAWHGKFGTKKVKVKLVAGETTTVNFEFSADDKPSSDEESGQ